MLKCAIIRPFLDEISKFLVSMKTILSNDFFEKLYIFPHPACLASGVLGLVDFKIYSLLGVSTFTHQCRLKSFLV